MEKKCRSRANGGYGVGLVRSTSFGRKRVALSSVNTDFRSEDFASTAPSKRQCFHGVFSDEGYVLDDLPVELLIRILCHVEHDDLKRLLLVSKAIRDATLSAKQHHFAYSTPKKTVGFHGEWGLGNFKEGKTPNAPKQSRVPRHRLSAKKLTDLSVMLFASADDERSWD